MDPNNQQPFNTSTPPTAPQPPIVNPSMSAPQPPQPVQPFAQPQPVAAGEDPGKGLAIAGIIFAFFMQIVGLILSIIAKKKSKAAGFDGKLATIGIILNAVFLVLGTLVTVVILVSISIAAQSGIRQRAATSEAQSVANSITRKAEVYNITKNTYPTSLSDFESVADASLTDYKTNITSGSITSPSDKVAIYSCGDDGIKVEYWDSTTDQVAARFAGLASMTSSCTRM